MNADNATLALCLANRGWQVFPCHPDTKAPLTRNGFKDATSDPDKIKSSLPSWGRGLKYTLDISPRQAAIVAPLVGAWIEISPALPSICRRRVAPLVGAWIEMYPGQCAEVDATSLPSWGRGLK